MDELLFMKFVQIPSIQEFTLMLSSIKVVNVRKMGEFIDFADLMD